MEPVKPEVTLHEPVTYQIKVPGRPAERWSTWAADMTVTVEGESEDAAVTVLTVNVDQAALHGLLRRLYALGLPLLSVNRVARQE